MSLTQTQRNDLYGALLGAFPSSSELARMVRFGLNENLETIAYGTLKAQVADLIRWAEAHGRTHDLVRGALASNPGNPLLCAFAASYLGLTASPSTPTPQESTPVTDYSTRPIHAAHAQGVVHLIRETLTNLPPGFDAIVRAYLFADDATYAELRDLSEEGARSAIADALADENRERRAQGKPPIVIPATRASALVLAVRTVTPARRTCPRCGRLDLAPVAARWEPATGDYCRANVDGAICEGTYRAVAFDPDVRAWTDGRTYPPGMTHDDARLPITDTAIRQWLAAKGGEVHPYLSRGLTATQGALDLPALCAHLVASRLVTHPLAALNALAKPLDANLFHDAPSAEVLCRKALESRGRTTATVETGATAVVVSTAGRKYSGPELTPLRKALSEAIPSRKNARALVTDIGISTARIDFDGSPEDMWGEILTEVNKHMRVEAIVARAVLLYPDEPALRSLRG